jgi:hypothetical protein
MRFTILWTAVVALGATIIVQATTRKCDFTDDAIGQPPKGFEFGHTANAGAHHSA